MEGNEGMYVRTHILSPASLIGDHSTPGAESQVFFILTVRPLSSLGGVLTTGRFSQRVASGQHPFWNGLQYQGSQYYFG